LYSQNEILQTLGHGAESGEPGLDKVDLAELVHAEKEASLAQLTQREQTTPDLRIPLDETVFFPHDQQWIQLDRLPDARNTRSAMAEGQPSVLAMKELGSLVLPQATRLQPSPPGRRIDLPPWQPASGTQGLLNPAA
jgi:hypothetical protein